MFHESVVPGSMSDAGGAATQSLSRGSVLVVDDNADTRHMIETYLDLEGFRTIGTENGLEGLASLREHRPCLILPDCRCRSWMISLSRGQLRLQERYLASVPVVVLSALNDSECQAERIAAVGAIPKPVDFERLLPVIRRYCI